MVARYDPDEPGWSAGPWRFSALIEALPAALHTAGGDAWISTFFHDRSRLLRLHDLARPERVPPSFVPAASAPLLSALYSQSGVFQVGDSAVVLEGSTELRTSTIDANDGRGTPTEILSDGVAAINATPLPELNQIAVCVVRAGVSLLILDERGALQHGPLWIEEDASAPTSGGRQAQATGCDLAWSGSELLIAWSTAEVRGPFVQPPGPEATPDARISGRIVKVSASGPEL